MSTRYAVSFKKWFAGSKVVDAAGQPLTVLHGTSAQFDHFDFALIGNPEEGGPFFTDNRDIAQDYGSRIIEVYLSIKNPYRLTYRRWLNEVGPDVTTLRQRGFDGFHIEDFSSNAHDSDADDNPDVGQVFVPFSPDQIRIVKG